MEGGGVVAQSGPEERPVLSPEERRQRNHEEMRQAILTAARAVMREQGAAALSLREVARRVRLQAPSLYAYFPSKAAIYDALFLEAFRRYRAERDLAIAGRPAFWDRLHAQFGAYLQFAQQHPELYAIAFERPVPGFTPSEASMAESWALLAGFEDVIDAAKAAGDIRPDVPTNEVRDLIIAMAHGLTAQHMANEPHLPAGTGRYGSLISAAVAVLHAAWAPGPPTARGSSQLPAPADGRDEVRQEEGGRDTTRSVAQRDDAAGR
jgi:AcrR family transcriptional regulator